VKRGGWRWRTVGADKGFDTREFVGDSRGLGFAPHVTQNTARAGGSAIDRRTTRHASYPKSQHARPRIEPAFGWLKTIAWLRKVKLRGLSQRPLVGLLRSRRVQPPSHHHADDGVGMIRSADARSTIRGLGIPDERFRIRDEGSESAISRISATSEARGSRIFHCWSVRSRLWHIPVLMP
jgi:hypothetical protein